MNDIDLRNIVSEIQNLPFLQYIQLQVVSLEPGKCELSVPAIYKILNSEGTIGSGVCSIICEAGAYLTACTCSQKEKLPVVYSTKISMLCPAVSGGLHVYSDSLGSEIDVFIESKVIDRLGNLIALCTHRFLSST